LRNPDFVKLAESFGATARRANSPESLRPVLESALDDDEPTVIEVTVERGSESDPWPFIMRS
jgi:acetolactate synthase-1/2/3 large subunit